MKVLIKNIKEFRRHNKIMEEKVTYAPYIPCEYEPLFYPCVVISYINTGVNGFMIKHEFVYKGDFAD